MRKIESATERHADVVTVESEDGKWTILPAELVQMMGGFIPLRRCGFDPSLTPERLPVMQEGRQVGTLPASFNPLSIASRSLLYNPRPGDFKLSNDTWIASPTLGPGDLEAVVGFQSGVSK